MTTPTREKHHLDPNLSADEVFHWTVERLDDDAFVLDRVEKLSNQHLNHLVDEILGTRRMVTATKGAKT